MPQKLITLKNSRTTNYCCKCTKNTNFQSYASCIVEICILTHSIQQATLSDFSLIRVLKKKEAIKAFFFFFYKSPYLNFSPLEKVGNICRCCGGRKVSIEEILKKVGLCPQAQMASPFEIDKSFLSSSSNRIILKLGNFFFFCKITYSRYMRTLKSVTKVGKSHCTRITCLQNVEGYGGLFYVILMLLQRPAPAAAEIRRPKGHGPSLQKIFGVLFSF